MGRTGRTVRDRRALRRRGHVLVYTAVSLLALIAVCSLAVDFGRAQLAQTELRRAADAAARYAVTGVTDGTALAKANWAGGQNPVDGRALTFEAADVEVGSWANSAFSPGGGAPNAVRVTARRTVPAVFGQVIGAGDRTFTARAVARFNVVGYGVVVLNSIAMTGNSTVSYWSGTGPYLPEYGNIASNGNIVLGGSSTVHGNAYYGPGKSVTGGSVTGTKTVLTTPLSYPNGDAGIYATTNDNAHVPSKYVRASSLELKSGDSLPLPGGNYYFNNFSMQGGSSLSFSGPATIYCYGWFSMSGHTVTSGSKPQNLRVVMCPGPTGSAPGPLTVGSSAALYATVYAPQSNVTLSGSGDIYGSVLGLTVNMTGTSAIHYDLALDANNGSISLAQ